MATAATRLGVALLVALASNAILFSLLLVRLYPQSTTNANSLHNSFADHIKTGFSNKLKIDQKEADFETRTDDHRSESLIHQVSSIRGLDEANDKEGFEPSKTGLTRDVGVDSKLWRHGSSPRLQAHDENVLLRSARGAGTRADRAHHLNDVIASLTKVELDKLDANTVKVLIPALVGLESLVLRELERLHDISIHQELRLEKLEKRQLNEQEITEAVKVIREEQSQSKDQQEAAQSRTTSLAGRPSEEESSAEVIDFSSTSETNAASLLVDDDGSGKDDEQFTVIDTTATTPATHYNESSDNAVINHIYEIYDSLTSLEHKVVEMGTSLTTVSSELYRQRSTFVRLEDKVLELQRTQRTLVLRSTMHGFKLSDLEQFRGQAELLLKTAEGIIEQFDAKLEIFRDRVTEQQDEMQDMRSVFGRLEQASNELRSADSFKAHDIQELKRGVLQVETRLSNLYHALDQYVGHVRWDVKSHLDRLCSNNNLQC